MTEFELFQALRPLYPALEFALLPQAANGTGGRASRHCDALALGLWPSRGMYLTGFEIKSYRGDWIRELRNPEKAEDVAKFCNYWYIVAGGAFVKSDELPPTWGLLTWDEKKSRLVKTKAAPFRKVPRPDFPFIAGILRKAQEVVTPDAALAAAKAEGYKAGREMRQSENQGIKRELDELKKAIAEFQKASGVEIDQWYARNIGEAVRQVLAGDVMRERQRLYDIAERIIKELKPGEECAEVMHT